MSEWLTVPEKIVSHNTQQGKPVMYQDLLNVCDQAPVSVHSGLLLAKKRINR
jgi:hypothetical protein